MSQHTYTPDDLPTREGMRTPYKGRHGGARFSNRTAPARFRSDARVGR